jgi:hypothetical protein
MDAGCLLQRSEIQAALEPRGGGRRMILPLSIMRLIVIDKGSPLVSFSEVANFLYQAAQYFRSKVAGLVRDGLLRLHLKIGRTGCAVS